MELPDLVNPNHTHGWWTLDSDDWKPPASGDTEYCIPPKPFWIHSVPEGTPRYTDWNELLETAAPHRLSVDSQPMYSKSKRVPKPLCREALLLQLLGWTQQKRSPKVFCLKHQAKQP